MLPFLLFSLLTLLAEIAGTIGGFGSSVFFVPMASWFFDFKTVLAITGLLHVFSNSSKIALFWKGVDRRLLFWIGLPSALAVMPGAWLTARLQLVYAELVLGLFCMALSVAFLLRPEWRLPATPLAAAGGGALSGFLAGLIGTGGVIRATTMAAFGLEKATFVATSAAIDFAVDLLRVLVYLAQGYLQPKDYSVAPVLLLAAVAGSWLGKQVLDRFSQAGFRRWMLLLIFCIGASMVIRFYFQAGR